ncbi:MAG TPA: hypothetical protein VEB21_15425, partial [Terriglobales bacterium]|nr:hypothetical protein [Terriglobales bacterium]
SDYQRVRDDLCASLEEIGDPESGKAIVARAWRREELYQGPATCDAPDIILELALVGGYSYTCLPTGSAPAGATVRRMSRADLRGGKIAGMPGSHRPSGMFIYTGAEAGRRTGLRIEDLGATVLAHCGVSAAGLDGVAIGSVAADEPAVPSGSSGAVPYSGAEEAELEERLSALGYL